MFGVILVLTFKLQKVVVAAVFLIRKLTADFGPRAVDGATAGIRIEETADPAEMLVFLAPHNALVAVVRFGEFALRLRIRIAMVLRQSFDIALGQRYDGIGAAVAGTVEAVVSHVADPS